MVPTLSREEALAQLEFEIPRLRRYARVLTRNRDHADDLVQDCLVRAMTKIDSWEPDTNLRAWLMTILRNSFINDCRRVKRERLAMRDPELQVPQVSSADQEARLMLTDVMTSLDNLSTEHREALLLVAVEDVSYEQAAEIAGVAVGTIKSRVARARRALLNLLGESESNQQGQSGKTRYAN